MKHYGDITKIHGDQVEPVDIITGGSPCQDLSVAGKRAGLDGERSGLFMEQIRITKEMRERDVREFGRTGQLIRPRFMVWENVPGAFSSNKGEDFRVVLEEIAKIVDKDAVVPGPPQGKWTPAGCIVGDGWSIAWRVHDAQFWGVPQRRKRIALVADFGGCAAPEILFEREGLSGDSEPCGTAREGTAGSVESGADSAICLQGNGIDRADTAKQNGRGWCRGESYTLNSIDRPAVYDEDPLRVRGGGNGPLIQNNKSGTLGCNNDQTLFCDVYNQKITGSVSPSITTATGGRTDQVLKSCLPDSLSDNQQTQEASAIRKKCPRPCEVEKAETKSPASLAWGAESYAVDCRNGTISNDTNGTLQAKSNGGFSLNCNTTVMTKS